MKVLVVILSLVTLVKCATYYTINDDLKAYFANDYDGTNTDGMEHLSEWDGDSYKTYGLPHYQVPCNNGTPNSAGQHDITLEIETSHQCGQKYALPMGPIGFAVNGVSIYNAVDSDEEDAYETEGKTFDACGASTDGSGRYHYHSYPGTTCPSSQGSTICFPHIELSDVSSADGDVYLIGVALDGFPIFVTIEDGSVKEESGLDDCGGKVYDNNNNYYAYFMYPHFPYTIRCFTGTVKSITGTGTTVKTNSRTECDGNTDNWDTYLCYRKGGVGEVKCLPSDHTDCHTVNCVIGKKCGNSFPDDTDNTPWTGQ